MNRRTGCLLLSMLLSATSHVAFAAEDPEPAVTRVFGDDLFAAGSRVRVSGESVGDAIAAGSDVRLTGTIGGDVVAAGRKLVLQGAVGGDLYAAAGDLQVDGTVAGNARLAGSHVGLGSSGEVTGGMSAAGSEVEVAGRVGRYLQIAAADAIIDGFVGGDVEVTGRELQIGPQAVIEGTLTFRGPAPPEVATGAQVRGGVRHLQREGFAARNMDGNLRAAFGAGAWLWLAGWLIAGCVLIAAFPDISRALTQAVRTRPGGSLLSGLLVLVGVPVVILILVVTLVGIPLGLVLLALYLVWLPLGYVAAAAALGEWLLLRLRRGRELVQRERILAFAGALLALFLLARVPVAGKLLAGLVLLAGMGSLVMVVVSRRGGGVAT